MAKARLFVALEMPKPVKAALARVIEVLRSRLPDAKWVPEQNLHLTLAFLGWAEAEQIPEISNAISSAVRDHVDFVARLGEVGAFPTLRRARVVWAGLEDATGGIGGLAADVCDAVARIGFPQEERPFHAHVTLARLRTPARLDANDLDVPPLHIPVDRATLFQSILGKPSPRYESLATFPFRRT